MQLIENATDQKLRGAYYTPPAIARFILQWGINGSKDLNIFEPSCGDGVFLKCIGNDAMSYNSVTAVEYEAGEAEKAQAIGLHDSEVINADFHRFCLDTDKRFNLVVGNPPFIRYQYYDPEQQELADEIFYVEENKTDECLGYICGRMQSAIGRDRQDGVCSPIRTSYGEVCPAITPIPCKEL